MANSSFIFRKVGYDILRVVFVRSDPAVLLRADRKMENDVSGPGSASYPEKERFAWGI